MDEVVGPRDATTWNVAELATVPEGTAIDSPWGEDTASVCESVMGLAADRSEGRVLCVPEAELEELPSPGFGEASDELESERFYAGDIVHESANGKSLCVPVESETNNKDVNERHLQSGTVSDTVDLGLNSSDALCEEAWRQDEWGFFERVPLHYRVGITCASRGLLHTCREHNFPFERGKHVEALSV